MYDKLIKRLRSATTLPAMNALCQEAADAIEELSREKESLAKSVNEASEILRKRWIPVTERLPEEYTRVIGFMAWKAMTAIEYQNGKWYSIDHLEPLPDEAVTHWMPLPKPPKEE